VFHILLRLFFIAIGVLVGAFVCYSLAWLSGTFLEPLFGPFYESEADMTHNFTIFLSVSIIFMISGGILGNWLYKKHLTKG